MSSELPIVVDLDGTLLRTDTLFEAAAIGLFTRPLDFIRSLTHLRSGRSLFKRQLAKIVEIDFETLPQREDFVAYLKDQKAKQRDIHLVTAADHSIAESVASRFGFFDSFCGSNEQVNLKGRHKREYLRQQFPDGYVYAGDSAADLAVWEDAEAIIVAGASKSTLNRVNKLGKPLEAEFKNRSSGPGLWARALRLHQWAKNFLVLIPLFLAGEYMKIGALIPALLAFIAIGLVASGTYLLNDLSDLIADRKHTTKRHRPFAAGHLSIVSGLSAAPLFIAGGLALGFAINIATGGLLAAYLFITLAYSYGLKRLPIVDVLVLAGLFTLRLLIGIAALQVPVSYWLMSFSMLLFLSLSMAKRHKEITSATPGTVVEGRGYQHEDAPFTLVTGLSSGMAAIVILCLYIMEDAGPSGRYDNPDLLWAAPLLIGAWILRIWLLAHRGELDDDPVAFALSDCASIGLGLCLGMAFFLSQHW